MKIREAIVADIPQMQVVRNAVKENTLSNPALVTDEDCKVFITQRGKGWVCEANNMVVGFAIADLQDRNIWALFLLPAFEGKGIGQQLHNTMLDWYFSQTHEAVWLGTAPHTRAEQFYKKGGWIQNGLHGKGEVKFEMTSERWAAAKNNISEL